MKNNKVHTVKTTWLRTFHLKCVIGHYQNQGPDINNGGSRDAMVKTELLDSGKHFFKFSLHHLLTSSLTSLCHFSSDKSLSYKIILQSKGDSVGKCHALHLTMASTPSSPTPHVAGFQGLGQ